ncbi:MAG: CynX/NimT family MFS transporter [Salinirussus sp.]
MADAVGRWEYGILVLGALVYAAYTFVWFSLPALLTPLIADTGLSTTQAGLVVGAVPLVYIPLGLVGGVLIDRLGSRTALGVAVTGFGVIQLVRGLATDFIGLLVPTLALGVLGMAATFGLPKLVSELFPAERTGSSTAVYQVGSQLGPVAAFGLSRSVLEPRLGGWEGVFLASGAIVLAFSAVWWIVTGIYARSSDTNWTAGDPDGTTALESARRNIGTLVGHRDMLLLVVVGTAYLFLNHGLRGWLAVILEEAGLAAGLAGVLVSFMVVAEIGGTLTIPTISDRWNRRKAALALSGLLCLVGTAGLLILPGAIPLIVIILALVGAGIGGLSPMIKAIPADMDGVDPEMTATAVSLIYAVGEIGGFTGPIVIGGLRDLTGGFAAGLGVVIAAAAVAVVASLSLRRVD